MCIVARARELIFTWEYSLANPLSSGNASTRVLLSSTALAKEPNTCAWGDEKARANRQAVGRPGRRGHRRPREWRMTTSHFAAPYLPDFAGVIPVKSFRSPVSPVLAAVCVQAYEPLLIVRSPTSPLWPPSPPPLPPVLFTRLFSFPLISVRCSRLFIAGVHTISRRTLTASTTSSSIGNYRIIAEKLLGPLEGTARLGRWSLSWERGTEGKRWERNACE